MKVEKDVEFSSILWSAGEQVEWDKAISDRIEELKNNRVQALSASRDAIFALSLSKDNLDSLENKGRINKFIGWITGDNDKLRLGSAKSLLKAQKASLQLIEGLSTNDILLMDSVLALSNYANYIHFENNRLREILLKLLSQVIESIPPIKEDVELLKWVNKVETKDEYVKSSVIIRVLNLVKGFCDVKNGSWSKSDLELFKTALKRCGIPLDDKFALVEFIKNYIDEVVANTNINDAKIKEIIIYEESNCDSKDLPIANIIRVIGDIISLNEQYGIIKVALKLANKTEDYSGFKASVFKMFRGGQPSIVDDKAYLKEVAIDYLKNQRVNLSRSINWYDVAIELLSQMRIMEISQEPKEEQYQLEAEVTDVIENWEKLIVDILEIIIQSYIECVQKTKNTWEKREKLENSIIYRSRKWRELLREIQLARVEGKYDDKSVIEIIEEAVNKRKLYYQEM